MTYQFVQPLVTTRLRLRRIQPGDEKAICRYRGLMDVARYQGWKTFNLEDAAQLIEEQSASEPGIPGTWFQLAIVESVGDLLIGDCGLYCWPDDPSQLELGITISPEHQRRGFATESLRCVLDYGFRELAMHRISAVTDDRNVAAAAVFRGLGFRLEGYFLEHRWFKGSWNSEYLFAILRREWLRAHEPGSPSFPPLS